MRVILGVPALAAAFIGLWTEDIYITGLAIVLAIIAHAGMSWQEE